MGIESRLLNPVHQPAAHGVADNSAGDWHSAIAGWSQVLAQASQQNESTFSKNEWNFLADMLRGVRHDPAVGNPGEYLPIHVMDAAWSGSLDARWLDKQRGESVQNLCRKVARLDYAQVWALVTACAWFWSFHAVINRSEEPWWTLAFRQYKASNLTNEMLAPDGFPMSYIRDGYWWNWFPGNGKRNRGRKVR